VVRRRVINFNWFTQEHRKKTNVNLIDSPEVPAFFSLLSSSFATNPSKAPHPRMISGNSQFKSFWEQSVTFWFLRSGFGRLEKLGWLQLPFVVTTCRKLFRPSFYNHVFSTIPPSVTTSIKSNLITPVVSYTHIHKLKVKVSWEGFFLSVSKMGQNRESHFLFHSFILFYKNPGILSFPNSTHLTATSQCFIQKLIKTQLISKKNVVKVFCFFLFLC